MRKMLILGGTTFDQIVHLQQLPVEICLQYGTVCAAYCITSKQLVYEQLSASFLKEQHQKIFG